MNNLIPLIEEGLKAFNLPEWLVTVIIPLVNILGAILVLIIGWWLASWMARIAKRACDKTEKIDQTITPLIVQTIRYAIIITAVITVLQIFGVGTTSILAALGSVGLAIGLAMQGALGNIASGIMIVSLRPFHVGNTVEVAGLTGVVEQIGLFYTRLNTFDGVHIVMPNSKIWGSEIKNFSHNPIRRMNLKFGISYADDISKAYAIIQRVYDADSRVLDEPAPTIAVTELADSSVNMIAYAWTKKDDWWDTQLDLVKGVKESFDAEGISIPFPQSEIRVFRSNNNQ